jgi:hypothetical protein
MVIDHAKRVPCTDCRQTFPSEAMDFDHRPGTVKVAEVARIKGLRALAIEMAKCDVVCAVCHRLRTKARREAHGNRWPA